MAEEESALPAEAEEGVAGSAEASPSPAADAAAETAPEGAAEGSSAAEATPEGAAEGAAEGGAEGGAEGEATAEEAAEGAAKGGDGGDPEAPAGEGSDGAVGADVAQEAVAEEAPPPAAADAPADEAPGEGAGEAAPAADGEAREGGSETAAVQPEQPEATAVGGDPSSGEVSVDFVILPEGYGQTKQLDLAHTVAQIRATLENELSIPEGSLLLMNLSGAVECRDVLPDAKALHEFGMKAGDRVGVELRINYYQEQPAEEYVMPDVLELHVLDQSGVERVVNVHVQRPVMEKPYLGGFRNKQSGIQFHHAVTQTAPTQPKEKAAIRFHREAQTYEYRTRATQSKRDNGTQMPKAGLFVDTEGDRELEPRRPYFSSADKHALVMEMCVVIQCHARGMFARGRARQLRKQRRDQRELEEKEAERRQLEASLRHKREVERRMHPRTFEDFSILYRELEGWRSNESRRIHASTSDEAGQRAAQRELLQKETKLLQTIDKLKITAHATNRDAKIKKKLESMSQPKVWAQNDGETTTVHTPFTTRAKELMDLYSGLRLPLLTVDERLDVLLHVKWTVKEFDCNLTREIVDLIDREADMLNRGRPEKSFVGLRRRLANLFLQFVETPEFNPESTKFQKVPRQLVDQGNTNPLSTVPIKAIGSA